jgi:hypothetical protein
VLDSRAVKTNVKASDEGSLTMTQPMVYTAAEAYSLGCTLRCRTAGKEPDVAGKKRPKSPAQTEKKAPAKPKRPKKTSRGK